MPRMGTFNLPNMLMALVAIVTAASCGVVTTITPERGMACATVNEASPVPGGKSINK